MRIWWACHVLILFYLVAGLAGCKPASQTSMIGRDQLDTHRARILLSEEPGGAVGILELRASMEGADLDEPHEEDAAADSEEGHVDPQVAEHDEDATGDNSSITTEYAETHSAVDDEEAELDEAAHDHAAHDEAVTGGSAAATEFIADVTVVGRIADQAAHEGVEASDFPWENGMAAFVIVDPAAEGEVEHHEHKEGEDCPFCAKKKIAAQAIVQFHSENKTPIAIDARELFGLKRGDLVVVRGDARLVGGVLMIDARQMHIRR